MTLIDETTSTLTLRKVTARIDRNLKEIQATLDRVEATL